MINKYKRDYESMMQSLNKEYLKKLSSHDQPVISVFPANGLELLFDDEEDEQKIAK
jgi:hypothetical protein